MVETGFIKTIREIWWDVRPHHNFGTVEVRICDMPPTLEHVLGLTALIQCLVYDLSEEIDRGTYQFDCHPFLIRQNKWRACRYGMDAKLVDPATYQAIPARQVVHSPGRPARGSGRGTGLRPLPPDPSASSPSSRPARCGSFRSSRRPTTSPKSCGGCSPHRDRARGVLLILAERDRANRSSELASPIAPGRNRSPIELAEDPPSEHDSPCAYPAPTRTDRDGPSPIIHRFFTDPDIDLSSHRLRWRV